MRNQAIVLRRSVVWSYEAWRDARVGAEYWGGNYIDKVIRKEPDGKTVVLERTPK